jgi:hypothetical protein
MDCRRFARVQLRKADIGTDAGMVHTSAIA